MVIVKQLIRICKYALYKLANYYYYNTQNA